MSSYDALYGDAVHADCGHVSNPHGSARQLPQQPVECRQPLYDHVYLWHPPSAFRLSTGLSNIVFNCKFLIRLCKIKLALT